MKDNPDTPEPKPEDLAVAVLHELSRTTTRARSPAPSSTRRRTARRRSDRAGQGGHGHPGDLLRHVAAGASRRRPGAGAGRHGDGLRLGPRSAHHARRTPCTSSTAWPASGPRRPKRDEAKIRQEIEQIACSEKARRRWAAWSACSWSTCWRSIWPCATATPRSKRSAGLDANVPKPPCILHDPTGRMHAPTRWCALSDSGLCKSFASASSTIRSWVAEVARLQKTIRSWVAEVARLQKTRTLASSATPNPSLDDAQTELHIPQR